MKQERRVHIFIRGAVQGVGFRPYVYRLARELNLTGWVNNNSSGVTIEAQGDDAPLNSFIQRLPKEIPAVAFIDSMECKDIPLQKDTDFSVRESDSSTEKNALVLPDLATCTECLNDIQNPHNRRFRYPFTNCTNCGPRFSIILELPYDRPLTTMSSFPMCDQCKNEYHNPADRRFHAQPNACPNCGPHLELWSPDKDILASHDEALIQAEKIILAGHILALKGIGGFHLICDATNPNSISELRLRKRRDEKPLALMYPNLESIKADCHVSPLQETLLKSKEAPIVLLKRRSNPQCKLAEELAPHNPYLGVMLPYSPLHHLLLNDIRTPIVATSGNLSDEPICTDEHEVVNRLKGIADFFLVHNRQIARHVDDSVIKIINNQPALFRRARGYAPLPIRLPKPIPDTIATGGFLKNTFAISKGQNVFLSQHIGDLETKAAILTYENEIRNFRNFYDLSPKIIIADAHPDYVSTGWAKKQSLPQEKIHHHAAHIYSVMAEYSLSKDLIGVSWDGTGYGTDHTIWGGEFITINESQWERVGKLRAFPLPGGEKAIKEPARAACGLLFEIYHDQLFHFAPSFINSAFTEQEKNILLHSLQHNLNTPYCSSAGRLFDGVASLLGLKKTIRFEGQAAMELEFLAEEMETQSLKPYRYLITDSKILDWQPLIEDILEDLKNNTAKNIIAARFHLTLAYAITSFCQTFTTKTVVLSGGVFQNRLLTEWTTKQLKHAGYTVYVNRLVPTNDGGLSLGQIYYSALSFYQT